MVKRLAVNEDSEGSIPSPRVMSSKMITRSDFLAQKLVGQPAFRQRQIEQALFSAKAKSWADLSSLSAELRTQLQSEVPFFSYTDSQVLSSKTDGSHKAVLELADGAKIETVLMKNSRDFWTICLSTQVGCARRCQFCATGEMGLKRNLEVEELVDQYRFWLLWLAEKKDEKIVSNLVLMGMGEPLDNYENVKKFLNLIFKHTEIGETHVTVSTVGVWPALDNLLTDEEWPRVRLAISLHSALPETRAKLLPSSPPQFLEKLTGWARQYLAKFGNRRHHLTFEYIMLSGVNDSTGQARAVADLVKKIGDVRVNLVPANPAAGQLKRSTDSAIIQFQKELEKAGVTVTVRRSLGSDILAACGQLAGRTG